MDTRTEEAASGLTAHELAARRAGDGELATRRALARLGAIAATGGALILFVSTLLHPLDSDANAPRAAFAEYAADGLVRAEPREACG